MFEISAISYDGNEIIISVEKYCSLQINDGIVLSGNGKKYLYIINEITPSVPYSTIKINSGFQQYSINNLTVAGNPYYDNDELNGLTTSQVNTALNLCVNVNFLSKYPVLASTDNGSTTTIALFGNGRNGTDIVLFPNGFLRNSNAHNQPINLKEHIVVLNNTVDFSVDLMITSVSYINGLTTITLTGTNRTNYLQYINGKTLTNLSISNHNPISIKYILFDEITPSMAAVKTNINQLKYSNTINDEVKFRDNLIKLATNNNDDEKDIGFYGAYNDSAVSGGVKYTGLVRDANDSGKYKIFTELTTEPNNSVANFNTLADFQCENIIATNFTAQGTALTQEIADRTAADVLKLDVADFNTLNNKTNVIFIDNGRQDSYIADGTHIRPYTNLDDALTAKLVEGATTSYIFKLAPGDYVGVNTFNMVNATQSFVIEGAGIDKTFIKGSASWNTATDDILFFNNFNDIALKNCTVKFGAYGFYPRNCRRVEIDRVKFEKCGSEGIVNRHDLTSTKQNQIDYWAGNSTNSGGAMRVRECAEVIIHNCQIEYCLRGCRIQDCGIAGKNSIICNNKMFRILESAIYLASGDYTGNLGCENFTITGNSIQESYNNSLLIIGGKHNIIHNNHCIGGANAGIMSWHSLDVKIHHNSVYNCNRLTHNGIGNDGDAYGAIVVAGKTNIGTGDHMAIIHSNSMLKCNQGRASSIIGVNIQPTEHSGSGAYPQASNKIVHVDNITDATDKITNVNNIPIITVSTSSTDPQTATNTTAIATNTTKLAGATTTEISYLNGASSNIQTQIDNAGGGGLTHPASLTHDGASTELKLENTSTDGEINFIFSDLNPSADVDDMRWRFQTDSANNKMDLYSAYFQHHQGGNATENLSMSIAKNGNIAFHGYNVATNINLNAYNVAFKGTVAFHGNVDFLGTSNVKSYFKFFPNNITTHQATGAISNAFELPNDGSTKYDLIYGDGTQVYPANVFGVRIRLPHGTLADGVRVHLHSNHNFDHSGSTNVLFITWNSDGGESDTTRSIIENDQYHTIEDGDNTNGELRIEGFTAGSGRGTITYTYILSINTWVMERGSY